MTAVSMLASVGVGALLGAVLALWLLGVLP